jgi:hypothetical protein
MSRHNLFEAELGPRLLRGGIEHGKVSKYPLSLPRLRVYGDLILGWNNNNVLYLSK